MSVVTQISGNIYPNNSPLRSLTSILTLIGIPTHPSRDELFFYNAESHAAWQRYDYELDFYKSIADSPFHIIYNDNPINNAIALQINYAMLKNRPILMTGELIFSSNINLFIRDTIIKHTQRFHAVRLAELELTELSLLLSRLKPIDYSLSRSERALINAGVKMHFRHLAKEAKNFKTQKS